MQEKEQAARKPDRRTLYTRRAVKDAMLELLEKQPYEKLTVAALCRQAEVTRSTFYLHYQSLDEVLNELLDEALMAAEAASNDMSVRERMAAVAELLKTGTAGDLRRNERLLGPCQRVADDPKYRAIFQDPTLSGYVISRIYRLERDQMIPYLMEECRINRNEADKLFMMIVYGLFYVNHSMKWSKDESWYEMQLLAMHYMLGGWNALEKRSNNRG